MKNLLKRNFTTSYNLLSASRQLFHKAYKKHGGKGHADYYNTDPEIVENITICDSPLSFFLRVILEYGHKTVIDFGTYTGYRIINIKRLLPLVDAYGLDIGPQYKKSFTKGNVTFSESNHAFFDHNFPKPIVICHSTLNCIKPDDLVSLLSVLREKGYPIALCEPVPVFNYVDTLKRSAIHYYHPYPKVLTENGFSLAETNYSQATWHSFSLSVGEYTYMNYAIPKKILL